MGGISTPELAAAVCGAGGLGMLAASADGLPADVDAVLTAAGGRPFGVNVLRSAVNAARALDDDLAGEVSGPGQPFPVPRFAVVPPNRATSGHIGAMALYAGQSAAAVTAVIPAADVVGEVMAQAEQLLHHPGSA